MNIVIFEDPLYPNFEPISFSHPSFMFLYGTSKIYEKWIKALMPKGCFFLCREAVGELLSVEFGRKKNSIPKGDNLFINGRFTPSSESIIALRKLNPGEAAFADDELLAFRFITGCNQPFEKHLLTLYEEDSYNKIRNLFKKKKTRARSIRYLWDMVDNNGDMIISEYSEINKELKKRGKVDSKAVLINKNNIAILSGAIVGPQVTIDASEGPVIVGNNTVIDPLTYIKGPVYIGRDCRLVGGKIREGCSFGPVCRVGGEVEESIMLGFGNKYHEGFLGHAYLGEWVNLGAMTTNSDLKNNYSEISVLVNNIPVNTGRIKVGCYIGDHTKTGIGTLLNTGISIGFSCNLYGGGLFADKTIKSFSWGTPGNVVEYRIDKAIETARNSMLRRKVKLTPQHELIFKEIYRASGWEPPTKKAQKTVSKF